MVKRTSIILMAALLLLLIGCGQNKEAGQDEGDVGKPSGTDSTYTYVKPDDTDYQDMVNDYLNDSFTDFHEVVATFTSEDDYTVFTATALIQYLDEQGDLTLNPMVLSMWGYHSPFSPVYLFGDADCYILHKDTDGTITFAMFNFDENNTPSIRQVKKIDGKLPVNEANKGAFITDDRVMNGMRAYWEDAANAVGYDVKNMIPYTYQGAISRFGIHGNVYLEIPYTDVSPTMPVYYWDVEGDKGLYIIISVDGDVWATEIKSVIDFGTKSVVNIGEPIEGKIAPLDLEAIQKIIQE